MRSASLRSCENTCQSPLPRQDAQETEIDERLGSSARSAVNRRAPRTIQPRRSTPATRRQWIERAALSKVSRSYSPT
jgi:hypothetical protein